MPSPRPIGSLASTVGTDRRWRRAVIGRICSTAQTVCFYSTKVRITVRAGDTVTVREGIGTGFGRAPQPEFAHDIALKAAETDATKRALATFGNPFGLALYDRDQAQVTKARVKVATDKKPSLQPPDLVLTDGEGKEVRFSDPEEFVEASLRQIERLDSTDRLYAFWSRNSAAFGKLRIGTEHGDASARKLADALKERARQVGQPRSPRPMARQTPQSLPASRRRAPTSFQKKSGSEIARISLSLPVSPVLICGRCPAQAHHLRFAQPRALWDEGL